MGQSYERPGATSQKAGMVQFLANMNEVEPLSREIQSASSAVLPSIPNDRPSPQSDEVVPLMSHWAEEGTSHPQRQVQCLGPGQAQTSTRGIQETAAQGITDGGTPLPHLDTIQAAFGDQHDLSNVRAHVGGMAATAASRMGATAYALGNDVAFDGSPDLHTAAHEAAHVVQQRAGVSLKGGVGEVGDPYEKNADEVADQVVAGKSAAHLLRPSRGGAVNSAVQCYKREGKNRISEDEQAVLADRQELYATDERMHEANHALASVGKQGSFVKLTKGNKNLKRKEKTLQMVIPSWVHKGENAGLHKGAEAANSPGGKDTEGNDQSQSGLSFALWTDCGRSSAAVTGAQNGRSVIYNDEGKEKKSHGIGNDGSVADWLNTAPGSMANEIYYVLIRKFITKPENAAFLKSGIHYEGNIADQKWKYPTTIIEAKVLYANLTEAGRDKFDKEAGINHHANPQIGEAYSMATEGQMPGFHEASGKTWNYHWAGVIMKAGSDNITLENFAVTQETAAAHNVRSYDYIDHDWNFDMYGTENHDQTFHHDHLASNTHGSHATTIRVQSDK